MSTAASVRVPLVNQHLLCFAVVPLVAGATAALLLLRLRDDEFNVWDKPELRHGIAFLWR
jgi:hypothetical protein